MHVEFGTVGERGEFLRHEAHLDAAGGVEFALEALLYRGGIAQLLHLRPQIPRHFIECAREVIDLNCASVRLKLGVQIAGGDFLRQTG